MIKKIVLFSLQFGFILIACGCLLGGLSDRSQSITESDGESPSNFDLLAQGISIGIPINDGKEALANYREHCHFELVGQDESGLSYSGLHDYLIEVDKPTHSQYEIQTIQSPSAYLSGTLEFATADGFTYTVRDDIQGGRICEKSELPPDTSHYADFRVTQILVSITPGELIEKNVRVNNVLADVYQIKDLNLLMVREMDTINGKVWIAREPAFFLKAEGEVEGVLEFENRRYRGKATFAYEVKDCDQVQIELPALCAHPPEEMIPLPPNAAEIQNNPPRINFTSQDSADQVKSFYLDALASQGWQVSDTTADNFSQVLQAGITTPQNIHIQLEIKIHAMGDGSTHVNILWRAQ